MAVLYSPEAGPGRFTPEPLREYISDLATGLVIQGLATMDEVAMSVGWASHPDCPLSDAQEIASVLEARADLLGL